MFRGKDIETENWVYGSLFDNKIIQDLQRGKEYYVIFNEEYEWQAQINYLSDPDGFSHLKDSVAFVGVDSVGLYLKVKDKHGFSIFSNSLVKTEHGIGHMELLDTLEYRLVYHEVFDGGVFEIGDSQCICVNCQADIKEVMVLED